MKTISNQIIAYVLISLSVVFVGRFFYYVHDRTQFENERLEKIITRDSEHLAYFLVQPILNHDLNLLKTNLNVEALDENIRSIQILDQNNHLYQGVLRVKDKIHPISGNKLLVLHQDSIAKPLLYRGKMIGKVVLYPNKEPLQQLIAKLKIMFFMELSVVFLITAAIMFFILKKVVINPLSSLKDWVSSINTCESIREPKLFHSTEMDTIFTSVTKLTDRLIDAHNESEQLSQENSLVASISTNLPEVMIYRLITDNNGRRKFTYLSSSFKKIYGCSPEEAMDNPSLVFSRVSKEDIRAVLKAEAKSKRELSTFRREVQMINPDGTIRFSRFVSTPTMLEDGSICWDGIELDITDLKNAQADSQQNESLLQSIAEELPDNIFAKNIRGRYIFVNSALAKRANKTPVELLGKNNNTIFTSDGVSKTWEMDLDIMKSGQTRTFEEELISPSGETIYLTTKGPIKDAKGKVIGLFGIARDITKLKRAKEALRVSQEKFQFAFDSSPNAILIQDMETSQITKVNASITKIFGYNEEEVLSKTPLELNLYKDPASKEKVLETLKKQGVVRNMEVIGRHRSGSDLHVLVSTQLHFIDNKPFLYTNIQDVTERKKVELELQKLNLDKDRFISILGHDLRGPVNGITGLLEYMHLNKPDLQAGEIEEMIDLAYKSAKNTSELLDDVLLWATAQSGQMKFNPQNINFKEDCLGIIKLLQTTANAKNIAIDSRYDDSLEVYADKNMLDTVLRNLISNALKFTCEGGTITVLVEKNTENTVISVSDNGVGIAPKDVDKIFDKSQLFTSIGTNKEKGTGFGLKLCQEFIQNHGGKIWVESELGKGTTFSFSLPNAN